MNSCVYLRTVLIYRTSTWDFVAMELQWPCVMGAHVWREVVWRVLTVARFPAETLRRIVLRFWGHAQSCQLSLFIVGSHAHFICVELKCRSLYMRSCCHGAPLTMWSCRLHIGHTMDMLGVKLCSVFWQRQNYLQKWEYVHEWSFNRIISNDLIKSLSRLIYSTLLMTRFEVWNCIVCQIIWH